MKKFAQVTVMAVALIFITGADNSDQARVNKIGSKIMCTCGCGQMLLQCNHVGCPNSGPMIRQLQANVQKSSSDEDVLKWFRDNWGVTAVVEPASHGFELLAWIMPPAALALGLGLIILVVRNWKRRMVSAAIAGVPVDPQIEAFRSRARRETEL
ncbi:MAG TPA: cytochrome c-type biogenesis protein CcmH [Candidatus Angelobacter sp.]|nr:cytochrome c-type biogenesis protein CcmH [Candidatus Angelobacter sp.]